MSGIKAKARAAVLLWAGRDSEFSGEDENDTTTLARSLLTDLAGMPDGASVVRFDLAHLTASIGGHKDWR
jgi:hypothetical protein